MVQLRGGTYRRVAPWVLRPEDSGTEASPVVYTACPGEQPVISGHTHHIGTGLLGSHCAIYALGTSPGTVIRNNHVHHVFQSPAWRGAGEGIILDNGCCGILVENNVVHDAVAGGFGTNFNCFGNVIVNNIFAYNLYFREGGTPVQFMKYSFDEWKAKGLDRNSVIADPRFADPARRDFTLPPDSPALRLGFQPIDLRRVGPRTP